MPPWLTQYENDDLIDLSYQTYRIGESSESPSFDYVIGKGILHGGHEKQRQNHQADANTSNNHGSKNNSERKNAHIQMQCLQLAMGGIFSRHPPSATMTNAESNAISDFSHSEIQQVLDVISVASHSNPNLADFGGGGGNFAK